MSGDKWWFSDTKMAGDKWWLSDTKMVGENWEVIDFPDSDDNSHVKVGVGHIDDTNTTTRQVPCQKNVF